MIDFIIRLLPYLAPAIRYADDPKRNPWRVDLLAYTIFVWVADMVLAHTAWAYYMGFPRRGEWTISHTLERTALQSARHREFAEAINKISPKHIKAVG